MKRSAVRVGGCWLAALLSVGRVAAQGADEPLDTIAVNVSVEREPELGAPATPSAALDEVVVTAQRREEPLESVPVSVTRFSAQQLQAAGVQSTDDLGRLTPGLQFTEISGASAIFLRGVGTDSFVLSADPSVATYVDGVYVPAQLGLLTALGGVESVEVIKGPQGTLFGRNSTAGAINLRFRTPSRRTEVSALAERRNFNSQTLQVYASTPLLDAVSIGFAGMHVERDSYLRISDDPLGPLELPAASEMPRDRLRAGRLKLHWTPTDEVDLTVGAFRTLMAGSSSTVGELSDPSEIATLLGIRAGETDYEIHRNEPVIAKVSHSSLSADLRWSAPMADLRLIAADQELLTDDGIIDYDYSRKDVLAFKSPNVPTHQQTAELQLLSNDGTPGSAQLEWIGGLYYLRSDAGFDPVRGEFFGNGVPLPLVELLPDDLESLLRGTADELVPGLEIAAHSVMRTESLSAFGQGTWHFSERLALTLGLRYQDETRALLEQQVNLVSPGPGGAELPFLQYDEPEVRQDNLSQKASLQWQLAPRSLAFLSYGKAYKSGTYNLGSLFTAPTYVRPEQVQSYELGFKSVLRDGSVRFNAALFLNEVKDAQTSFIAVFGSGSIVLENAGRARVRGAEFDLQALPLPQWNRGLSLMAGACFVDAVYTDYPEASGYAEGTGMFRRGAFDLTGNEIARSPRLSGHLGLNQDIDVGAGRIELGVDAYYNSGFYYTAQNLDTARQKAYSLLNARIGYYHRPTGLRLTAFGINLDDETFSYAGLTADFGTAITLAPPRIYGLRLQWDY